MKREKARNLSKLGLIKRFSSRLWLVPGSEGKRYEVRRLANSNSFECHRLVGSNPTGFGRQPCFGNEYSICYHVLTLIVACTEAQDWSIEVDAEDYGFDISYPDHEETLRQIFEEMFGEFVV